MSNAQKASPNRYTLGLTGAQSPAEDDSAYPWPADRIEQYTATALTMALPWAGMDWLAADGRSLPPVEGDIWRMDFSRFNQYCEAPPARDSAGWMWSPHGERDSHIPECFPIIRFTEELLPQDR